MPRSLLVRSECLPLVKSSLLRNGFPSQKILAEDLGIAQSTVSNFLNGKPVDYANFIEICARLGQEWRDIASLEERPPLEAGSKTIAVKIWVGDRGASLGLSRQLQQALSATGYQVFLGTQNARVGEYLNQCDYLLLLLSEESVASEIAVEEVQFAQELHQQTPQKPAILPIYIDFSAEFPLSFDLFSYLQYLQPWQWNSAQDSSRLISEILAVLREGRRGLPADAELAFNGAGITVSREPAIAQPVPTAAPELPGGQVAIASHFYIPRPPIESRCYETISQPGALIRIKAPRQMGKTSLMARILQSAEQQGSRTVALSFQLANKRVFTNSDTFLQWFCAIIGQELGQLEFLNKCWELADIIGSNLCCKAYFEQYLLSENSTPITLGLDEVDRVFESPEIADDFFGLLRALHEEAKRREIWKKFRLVVVHSTEVYIPLDVNKSPFNVGLPIELPEFNSQQVQELAKRHGLIWNVAEVEELMALVGGHPYLVRLALYHIARQDITLNKLMQQAPTEAGIYGDHLRRHLWNLEKYAELMAGMREVVNTTGSVRLRSELAFKLNSMGLVKLEGNDCSPRCKLYEEYFRDRLSSQ
ncbi:MAG: AAA-like domain-containing protein [Actinomycetota bacterium]